MTTKITYLLVFLGSTILLQANPALPFWTESFESGFPSGWESGDLTGNGNFWEHCGNFYFCAPNDPEFLLINILNGERFKSATVEDGYMYLRPYQQGSATDAHLSHLTSPPIDCSAKNEVYLKFHTLLMAGVSSPDEAAILQVRAGNTGPWTDFILFEDLNEEVMDSGGKGFQTYNPQVIWLDITGVAGNEEEVYIRWLWEYTGAEEYFWGIDDVELTDENPVYERVIWGQNSGEGDFNGNLNAWTVESGGSCPWSWDEHGLVNFPTTSTTKSEFYAASYTAHNGVALLDTNDDCLNNFNRSDLISPVINLSNVPPNRRLALKFHQTGMMNNPQYLNMPFSSVMLSLDGGATYFDTLNANPLRPYNEVFSETTIIPLPYEVSGASYFRFKFVYAGLSLFWMLDDVRIIEQWNNDLIVRPDFYSVSPNAHTPAFLVSPISFSAQVENVGNQPQDFTKLFVEMVNDSLQQIVFRDTLELGTVEPGETVADTFFSKTFLPEMEKANYSCIYHVRADLTDEAPLNNSVRFPIIISKGLYSKNMGRNSINGSFAPFSSNPVYEVGNCFFIPPGAEVMATGLSFAFGNAPRLEGTTLRTNLYKWKTATTFADENGDSLVNLEERELVAFNNYQVSGLEGVSTVVYRDIDFELGPVVLEDSCYYIVTVEYNDPVFNPNTGNPEIFFISGSEEMNYSSMFWQSLQSIPRYVSMLRLGDDDFFRANSWGLQRIPFVQLHISKVTNTTEGLIQDIDLAIFPNPVAETLWLSVDKEIRVGELKIEVFDIWGRSVYRRQIENGNVSQLPIDVSELSNGSYILQVISDERFGNAKFVVAGGKK